MPGLNKIIDENLKTKNQKIMTRLPPDFLKRRFPMFKLPLPLVKGTSLVSLVSSSLESSSEASISLFDKYCTRPYNIDTFTGAQCDTGTDSTS